MPGYLLSQPVKWTQQQQQQQTLIMCDQMQTNQI